MSAPDAGLSRQAIKLYQSGHPREAEPLFRRLLEQDPDNWQHALLLGLCRQSLGDIEDALKWVGRSVELGDGQPGTHYYYGRLMADNGQPMAAREQFSQAIALDPNHVEARTGMGLVSMMSGDFERAVSELRTALRARDDYIPALTALARCLIELEQYEEAWPHANKALQAGPENPVALRVSGQVLLGLGQLDLAERCFREGLEKRPESAELHAGLAELLKLRNKDHEALEHYGEALKRDFGGARLVIDATVCLERLGDLSQARRLMQKARERWPGDVSVALRLAELTMLGDDPHGAREILAGLDGDDPAVLEMQARVADYLDQTGQARELLERVVETDTEGTRRSARLLLARVLSGADPHDTQAAREPIAAMLRRKPPVPDAVLVWALVCERAGNYAEACRVLEELLEQEMASEADRRVIHNRLANCYDLADERALAWANWQKGAWRIAPHAARLEAQRGSGALDAWLAWNWTDVETRGFDDGYPAPVIIAGWPGSGREMLLAGLLAHPAVQVLERAGENRRLDALGVPARPDVLFDTDHESLRLGRKRFMRGVRRGGDAPAVTLDPGWWQASAIPPLARHFPGATVVLPAADPDDLALQWRVDGYTDVDGLIGEYRRELQLWNRMRERLELEIIEVARAELLDDVAGTLDRVCTGLGLEPAEEVRTAAARVREMQRFVPAGGGARYQPMGAGQGADRTPADDGDQ